MAGMNFQTRSSYCHVFVAPVPELPETSADHMVLVAKYMVTSLQVNYKLDGDTVIEISTFTDVDNSYVKMWRSVEKDGSGQLIYTKSGESMTTALSQIAVGGVGTGASILVGLMNVPAGIAISIATFL